MDFATARDTPAPVQRISQTVGSYPAPVGTRIQERGTGAEHSYTHHNMKSSTRSPMNAPTRSKTHGRSEHVPAVTAAHRTEVAEMGRSAQMESVGPAVVTPCSAAAHVRQASTALLTSSALPRKATAHSARQIPNAPRMH